MYKITDPRCFLSKPWNFTPVIYASPGNRFKSDTKKHQGPIIHFKSISNMMNKFFTYLTVFCSACFLFTACGSNTNETNGENQSETAANESATTAATNVKLSDFTSSPAFPEAKLSMDYKGGKFTFKVDSKTYQLGEQTSDAPQKMCANSPDGQHIHLIVDNGPYDALYKTEFEKEVADGERYLLAFLSRSYHESIKTPTAFSLVKGTVANNSLGKTEKVTDPMVFYSRPKGKYVGKSETDKVMLDFYLANVSLSADGYKVKALVNGETEFTLTEWKPYFLEGLPMGDNKIKLTLVDKDDKPVNSPLNPIERVFTLVKDPAPGQ